MIELKDYQKKAAESLKGKVENVLKGIEAGVVIFQAPTGSGKTVMTSEALRQIARNREDNKKLSFIWISVRMLHRQSKEKIEKYYEDDRLINCSYFEELEDLKIGENEILFLNWHSINKKDINIYVRENEEGNNLNSIIGNTKEDGREIILIIDESHHTARSEKSRELIEAIEPKVTIEVSATPQLKESVCEIENVRLAEVKAEEMIKSEIAVNPEFMKLRVSAEDSDTVVIRQALKKREELVDLYNKEKANINPLLLIQLPDSRGDLVNKKDDVLGILKDKFNITEKNRKLAVWLSEEKTDNLLNIDKNNNEIEVLVFKQAIALGWDCPRASILVIFRESKSFIFTIQTIGRIMRMPELKYYGSEELNKGFVFTNLPNIEITENYAEDYVTVYESKRDNKRYKNIEISSIYLKRQRERTRLSGEFVKIFMDTAEKTNLKNKITIEPNKITIPIIADGRIVDVDTKGKIERKGQIEIKLNEVELQQIFNKFIIQNCSPYAPIDSSDRMKRALYQFLKQKYKLEKLGPKAQGIVVAKENRQFFIDALNQAKEKYRKEIIKKLSETRERIKTPKWEVPIVDSYKSNAKKQVRSKSIMNPFFIVKPSKPEELFISLLNDSDKIDWWYKNREGEKKYFALEYYDENDFKRTFYVDFIVKFRDDKIGLFDTKSGMTAKEAGPRAEGLQKYIKQQKQKGKKLFGGIVITKGDSFFINKEEKYKYNPSDLLGSGWRILEI